MTLASWLTLSGCATPTVVVVPETREGNACWGSCAALHTSCVTSYLKGVCLQEYRRCLKRCPGAYVAPTPMPGEVIRIPERSLDSSMSDMAQ